MSFDEVAKKVIKDSIRSAICIDDEFPSAYQEGEFPKRGVAKTLYESFRNDGHCDLDVYNFQSLDESWHKDYMLFNKDLMILDWELDQNSITNKFDATLNILNDVIESEQIPFVVIYTHTTDLSGVSKALIEKFAFITDDLDGFYSALNSELESSCRVSDLDIEQAMDDLDNKNQLLEYVENMDERGQIKQELSLKLYQELKIVPPQKVELSNYCKSFSKMLKKVLEELKIHCIDPIETLALIRLFSNEGTGFPFQRSATSNSTTYKINNTLVMVVPKKVAENKGVEPNNLFSYFSEAIISNPNNYLTVLSLELKDQLRQEFSKIGAKFSQIDEKAFLFPYEKFPK